MQLGHDPTQEELDRYIEFWRTRGEKVAKIMGWDGCFAFNPDFDFSRDEYSTCRLPLDVVDKLIELHEAP